MSKETDRREPTDDEAREMPRKRLAETIRWCSPRAGGGDPAASLRNSALKPRSFGGRVAPSSPGVQGDLQKRRRDPKQGPGSSVVFGLDSWSQIQGVRLLQDRDDHPLEG
jgi:hypothetical protein